MSNIEGRNFCPQCSTSGISLLISRRTFRSIAIKIACPSWAELRSFKSDTFHRMPPSSKQCLQMPFLTFPDYHDLRHAPFDLHTRMIRLFPECSLDVFKICCSSAKPMKNAVCLLIMVCNVTLYIIYFFTFFL